MLETQNSVQVVANAKMDPNPMPRAPLAEPSLAPEIMPDNELKSTTHTKKQQFLEHNSLRIAGALNLAGDLGLLVGGVKTRNPHKFSGGLLYTLGGLNLTLYGSADKAHIMQDVCERTAEFMEGVNGDLPNGSALGRAQQHKSTSTAATIDRFLHRQPAQHTMGLYTTGAAAMMSSGIQQYRMGEGGAALAYGVSSLGVKLASFVTPETPASNAKQQHEEEHTGKHRKKKGAVAWLKEKPLRIFGYGSLISEAALAVAGYQEYKHAPQKGGYMWTALSSGSYMVSDLLMATAHKDPNNGDGKFTEEEKNKVAGMMAEVIAGQPKAARKDLMNQSAAFLARQPEIRCAEHEIRELLHAQVTHMVNDSWASRTEHAERSQSNARLAISR